MTSQSEQAAIELRVDWEQRAVRHCNRQYFDKFNFWCDILLGLVLEYFRRAGNFTAPRSESLRSLPRPREDRYSGQLAYSDPVFAVWGHAET